MSPRRPPPTVPLGHPERLSSSTPQPLQDCGGITPLQCLCPWWEADPEQTPRRAQTQSEGKTRSETVGWWPQPGLRVNETRMWGKRWDVFQGAAPLSAVVWKPKLALGTLSSLSSFKAITGYQHCGLGLALGSRRGGDEGEEPGPLKGEDVESLGAPTPGRDLWTAPGSFLGAREQVCSV